MYASWLWENVHPNGELGNLDLPYMYVEFWYVGIRQLYDTDWINHPLTCICSLFCSIWCHFVTKTSCKVWIKSDFEVILVVNICVRPWRPKLSVRDTNCQPSLAKKKVSFHQLCIRLSSHLSYLLFSLKRIVE